MSRFWNHITDCFPSISRKNHFSLPDNHKKNSHMKVLNIEASHMSPNSPSTSSFIICHCILTASLHLLLLADIFLSCWNFPVSLDCAFSSKKKSSIHSFPLCLLPNSGLLFNCLYGGYFVNFPIKFKYYFSQHFLRNSN